MAGEWEHAQLGDIASTEDGAIAIGPFGSRMKADVYVPEGVPVIRGTNISKGKGLKGDWVYVPDDFANKLPNCLVKAGDLVFPHRGSIGEVALIEPEFGKMILSSSMMKFRPNPQLADSRFLYYFFRSAIGRAEILKFSSQVGTPGIGQPLTSLRQFSVWLPASTTVQKAIAHILGTLDDKIELNRQMNETLEAMARAIFKSWFVDFDPVRAKMNGEKPHGMDEQTAALFPGSFEDSPLGKIPIGWKVGHVSSIAKINDWTLGKKDALESIDYVEISKVMRGEINEISNYIRGKEPSRARRRLRHGDTAISTVRPDRGSYFLALNPPQSLIASTGFAVLTPNENRWAFLHTATTLPEFGEELGRLADGGAYPAIRPEVIALQEIVLPENTELIGSFEQIVQPMLMKANHNRQEMKMLADIRDTLLPRLLSGRLRVPEMNGVIGRDI